MSTYHIIYETTNLINGKKYRGKHTTNNIDDDYLGSGKHLKLAIKKYGVVNFSKEILFCAFDYESMNYAEHQLVSIEWVNRSDTYNIRTGGGGGWNEINSDSKRQSLKAIKSNAKQKELYNNPIWVANRQKAINAARIYCSCGACKRTIEVRYLLKHYHSSKCKH